MSLPTDAQERKRYPVASGFLKYFPLAAAEIAHLSLVSNDQHNPGQELHWAKEKSSDEPDALVRHMLPALEDPLAMDSDGLLHLTKVAWRAMAWLERVLEREDEFFKPNVKPNVKPNEGLKQVAKEYTSGVKWATDKCPNAPDHTRVNTRCFECSPLC